MFWQLFVLILLEKASSTFKPFSYLFSFSISLYFSFSITTSFSFFIYVTLSFSLSFSLSLFFFSFFFFSSLSLSAFLSNVSKCDDHHIAKERDIFFEEKDILSSELSVRIKGVGRENYLRQFVQKCGEQIADCPDDFDRTRRHEDEFERAVSNGHTATSRWQVLKSYFIVFPARERCFGEF